MLRTIFYLLIFLSFIFPGNVFAKNPWQWRMSLRTDSGGAGALYMPSALYIDAEKERYYVVDSGNNRLVSFDRNGKLLNMLSAGDALNLPFDMARESSGAIWVVEKGRNSLSRVDLSSKKVVPYTLEYKGEKIFPHRLEQDGDVFYTLDKATGKIFSFDNEIKALRLLQCNDCKSPFIDFILRDETIWALSQQRNAIFNFTKQGEMLAQVPIDSKTIKFPFSLELDAAGLLYILDRFNGSVVVLDQNGNEKYQFLTSGHVRGNLYYPIELRFDPWGQLCIVDEGNGRVEIFSR